MNKEEYIVRISWKWGAILDYHFTSEEVAKDFIIKNEKIIIRYIVI